MISHPSKQRGGMESDEEKGANVYESKKSVHWFV